MTKERILEMATQEFSKHGFDGVSMNALVKLLGVNKATIYYHYKDKRALYQECLEASLSEVKLNRMKSLVGIDEPKEKFKAYIKALLITIKDKPYMVGLWMHEVANFGSNMDEKLVPMVEEKIGFLKELLSQLPLKEHYKNTDPYLVFSVLHGTIDNFYAMQMSPLPVGSKKVKHESEKTLEYLGEFLADFILDALCEGERK